MAVINGTDASETINGTEDNDTIHGNGGDDIIYGNGGDDVLEGGEGSDQVYGGAGNDTLYNSATSGTVEDLGSETLDGGTGDDVFYVADGTGSYGVAGGDGYDTLYVTGAQFSEGASFLSGLHFRLSFSGIEHVVVDGCSNLDSPDLAVTWDITNSGNVYIGNGNDRVVGAGYVQAGGGDDYVTGAVNVDAGDGNDYVEASDTIDGGAGDDTLIGAYYMAGESGNDLFVVPSSDAIVDEGVNGGIDTVQSSFSFVLPDNVETLTLTGTNAVDGTGNALDNIIDGNEASNVLAGNQGADSLDGYGGDDTLDGGGGADTLVGGLGNDIYVVDDSGDQLIEDADAGVDLVESSISFKLASNFEQLTLTGGEAIDATGNDLANFLRGNSGNNILDGGAGADTMYGGLGDDTYIVDDIGDQVIDEEAGGTDQVNSSVSFTMGANLENLTLTGDAVINAKGNELDNAIVGNAADNVLDGGAGADTMRGGDGNDTYIVDNVGDQVTEDSFAGGIDLVRSSATFTIGANIEYLTLTGDEAINGTGNDLANRLIGNTADNVLNGGGGSDTLSGAAGNDTLNGGVGADAMYGGIGNDTYFVDDAGDTVTENAGAGIDTVNSSVSRTLGANVENLTLIGNETISGTGNELANVLTGNAAGNVLEGAGGADMLDGGAGGDTMYGGAGNDTYVVDNTGDQAIEYGASGGVDVVKSSVSFAIGGYIENLTLTGNAAINGTGNDLANHINGNSAANVLSGAGGADTLDGGAGADTMYGGFGDDIYIVDDLGDQVIDEVAGGADQVNSAVSFTLGANLENLTLTGNVATNALGNDLENIINGNAADNVLDGGAGADTMHGGAGNDTYIVDDSGDQVIEGAFAGGIDLVRSSVTFHLGANIENLTLTGSAAINGIGNDLANRIIGNSADNILNGAAGVDALYGAAGNDALNGGTGADTMYGGAGDDTYIVDDAGDAVIENANAGIDTVNSGLSLTLGAHVENLTLTGNEAISGTGNELANVLTGNAAANVLKGAAGSDTLDGGAGGDTMYGGAGNDTYIVDNTGDQAIEYGATGGADLVKSSISFTIGGYIENLTLTGAGAISGTGNGIANLIKGNSAANALSGAGGADTLNGGAGADTLHGGVGNDTLIGGAGTDHFCFDAALNSSTNVDDIVDFSTVDDTIELAHDIFIEAGALGTLSASAFYSGTAAHDADDRIIFDSGTGNIYYDADGSGAGAQVLFAHITPGLALTNADFQIFG